MHVLACCPHTGLHLRKGSSLIEWNGSGFEFFIVYLAHVHYFLFFDKFIQTYKMYCDLIHLRYPLLSPSHPPVFL